jgi:Ni,Fe-hydrogenase I cytochrome b subunit
MLRAAASPYAGLVAFTEYKVWDRTQRVFHWINALAVVTLAAIGLVILNADALGIPNDPGMIVLKTTHVYAGYVFALNLGWRLVWAFVGGPHARWSALLPWGNGFGRRLVASVIGLLGGRMSVYLAHTPLARIVLSALVLLLVVQAATGLVLAGTDVYMPPLGGYFAEQVAGATHEPALVRPYAPETVDADAYAAMRAFRAPVVATHELTFFLLVALVAVHVVGAVLAELKEGTVISAMFTGRKILRREPVDVDTVNPPAR